jgi:hypothetical protein
MGNFAVVRHPDVAVPGILPEEALPVQRLRGWYRVSDFAAAPADFDLNHPDFGPDAKDRDAEPEPDEDAPKTKTARKATAKTTNTEEDEA